VPNAVTTPIAYITQGRLRDPYADSSAEPAA
jgi:hypothetical protein